ncbi:MAG TPA: PadR family transcriptional regulator [Bryobacteraceae bacterium]|nr:PadR family transcriptional regulator [Bryobacteraceae bacterium]
MDDLPEPLKAADFHILLVLLETPRHGYEIMKEVERESGGRVRLEVGTLYRLLARLLDEGLLEQGEEDGRRRNYALTRAGRRALKSEAERLAGVVNLLRVRKLLPQGDVH